MTSGQLPTLREFLTTTWSGNEQLAGLDAVVMAIADGSCQVQAHVQSAALGGVLGVTGDVNVQGEIVERLDQISSDTFVQVLSESGSVAAIGCEEIKKPVIVDQSQNLSENDSYMVLMDPLDGSSNIDVAVSIGSIFGIWPKTGDGEATETSLLRPGNEQVAAVYVVYGSSTVFVMATHNRVSGFTLDPNSSNYFLTHPDIQIPNECPYYSTNEGNFKSLDEATQQAVIKLRNAHSQRYVGSLVADFHRNLLKGGIFLYPADQNRQEGRLRLMYEANPLGFVTEQAGGAASTGYKRILDIMPEKLHQRTPLILGNKDVVEQTVSLISGG